MQDERPIICVDLDGVLNEFDGWKCAEYFHPPRAGAREFLRTLRDSGYRLVVFTCRWAPDVEKWLAENGLAEYVSEVTDKKPPAHVYIDDRALRFSGDFNETLCAIASFKAHWE